MCAHSINSTGKFLKAFAPVSQHTHVLNSRRNNCVGTYKKIVVFLIKNTKKKKKCVPR